MELIARAALSFAAFMVVGSLLMLRATEAGTPERTITVFSLAGGLAAIAITGIAIRLGRRRRSPQEEP